MANTPIIDGDELQVTVTFKQDGVPQSPTSAAYRVEDMATGDELRALTSISSIVSGVATVTLTFDDNTVHNAGSDSEMHELIVIANFGTDTAGKPRQITRSFKYQVQRSP